MRAELMLVKAIIFTTLWLVLTCARCIAQCELTVGPAFDLLGVDDTVHAVTQFNNGTGNALYVGGRFRTAGAGPANRIAKWNGTQWSSLGDGLNGDVYALTSFDDGKGPALYAGGAFSTAGGIVVNHVAKWDGSSWSSLADGLDGTVYCFAVLDDDADGPHSAALYAGGNFAHAGEVATPRIARWDGDAWHDVGGGVGLEDADTVLALTVFDSDESGPSPGVLVAGGHFAVIGELLVNHIAKWDGRDWSPLGSGVRFGEVFALASFDSDSGPLLYVGGDFLAAGDITARSIASWNGNSWSSVGAGISILVDALTVFDADGSGPVRPSLYIGGDFQGLASSNIMRWDGFEFRPVGNSGVDSTVFALGVYTDSVGPTLVVGGEFTRTDRTASPYLARWRNAVSWIPTGRGLGEPVRDLVVFDDGRGEALFCATTVYTVAGGAYPGVARWNGSAWSSVGLAADARFHTVFHLASGPNAAGEPTLFAAGIFDVIVGADGERVARWNGQSWIPLGSSISGVRDLMVFDDGSGPALFACGSFTFAGAPVARVVKWIGDRWVDVGGGMNRTVHDLDVFDDGHGGGPALYAAGEFTLAGGAPANYLARWNGSTWTAVPNNFFGPVLSMTVHRADPERPTLVVNATSPTKVHSWDGDTWTLLDGYSEYLTRLVSLDLDGDGPRASELFGSRQLSQRIGDSWTSWGSTTGGSINALAVFDTDGPGPLPPAIFAGGDFNTLNGVISGGLASIHSDGEPPHLEDLPAQVLVDYGDDILLTVDHEPASPVFYVWRRNGVRIESPFQGDRTFRVQDARPSDSGAYDVVVSTPCGTSTSSTALVSVICLADWNRSTFVDSQDFFDFLLDFFGNDADFNHDSVTNSSDYYDFLKSFFARCE